MEGSESQSSFAMPLMSVGKELLCRSSDSAFHLRKDCLTDFSKGLQHIVYFDTEERKFPLVIFGFDVDGVDASCRGNYFT